MSHSGESPEPLAPESGLPSPGEPRLSRLDPNGLAAEGILSCGSEPDGYGAALALPAGALLLVSVHRHRQHLQCNGALHGGVGIQVNKRATQLLAPLTPSTYPLISLSWCDLNVCR